MIEFTEKKLNNSKTQIYTKLSVDKFQKNWTKQNDKKDNMH